MNLFTSGSDGIGDRLYDSVNKGIDQLGKKAGSPGALVDSSFLSTRLKDLDEQMQNWKISWAQWKIAIGSSFRRLKQP